MNELVLSISIAEHRTAKAPVTLVTYGLGSCVAIALYDPEAMTGSLAHALLPSPAAGLSDMKTAKYTGGAVDIMVDELINNGCVRERLVAKLAGGACMFDTLYKTFRGVIGDRNIAAAKAALEKHGIPVIAEDTGGDYGRTVEFSTKTGKMVVKALQRPDKTI